MMKLRSRLTSRKVVYIIAISIALTCILFVSIKMFSKVNTANTTEPRQNITIADLRTANSEVGEDLFNPTSRGSSDIRTATDEPKTETKTEEKKEVEETTKKEETKKEEKSVKSENKKEASTTKSNTTKKTTETKKQTSKKTEKTENKTNKKVTDNKEEKKEDSSKKSEEKSSTKTETKKEESKKSSSTKKENKKSATKSVSISKVKISKSMNLTKRTGLSREDFIKLISGVKADTSGFFEKNAGTIYDLCKRYSINEIFFCGLISAESGWNIASNHRRTHNYISLMRNGKLIKYGSTYEGLEVAAQKLHYNYLTPGGKFYHGKTLAGVKTCFCPSSGWVNLVYGRMKQIL